MQFVLEAVDLGIPLTFLLLVFATLQALCEELLVKLCQCFVDLSARFVADAVLRLLDAILKF